MTGPHSDNSSGLPRDGTSDGTGGAARAHRAGAGPDTPRNPDPADHGDSDPAAEDGIAPRGLYDPDPDAPGDLPWFVPDRDDDPDDTHGGATPPWARPGPRAAPRPDTDDAPWDGAEARNAGPLARAALAVGALDDRVRCAAGTAAEPGTRHSTHDPQDPHGPAADDPPDPSGPRAYGHHGHPGAGLRRRLLCAEIADLAWHLGDRVTVDRLALYLVLRLPGLGVHDADDAQALARAAWAWRRLDHGADPPLDDPPGLAAWLGRAPAMAADTPDPALIGRPVGTEFDALAQDWARGVTAQADRHPFVQAAAAWQGWRARGLSGDDAEIEGAVLAARIAARALRPGGLGFVPLGLGGGAALRAGGDTDARLAAWLAGIESAALRGLMECDRLAAWEAQARDLTAPMSGRTPARLIDALAAWPIVSAPMLAAQTGASRAAVQRNMIRFEDLGLVRELTGQARFRFWRAAL